MHLIARAVEGAVQHQQGGCLFRRLRRVIKLSPGTERSPHQHHIGPGAYPDFDTAMPILRQPDDTVADIKLPGLILAIQPGNSALRHRAAIRIVIHQDGVLTEAHVQIGHLHHHIAPGIERFLRAFQLPERIANLRVGLRLKPQQVHTGQRLATYGIIQPQHGFTTLQHAIGKRRNPATRKRSGILQHHAASRSCPLLRLAGCRQPLISRIHSLRIFHPPPVAGFHHIIPQLALSHAGSIVQFMPESRSRHVMRQAPGLHLHTAHISRRNAQTALSLQRHNHI